MTLEPSSLIRQHSRRSVVEALLDGAPCSRADLSRVTGLSKQTISQVMAELEGGGWVMPIGNTKGNIGRSAVAYEISGDAAFSFGVDLGGSKINAALANLAGKVVAEAFQPTDARGGTYVVEQIANLANRLSAQIGVERSRIRSVVIGSPGVVDPDSGAIKLVPNIKGLSSFDVGSALSAQLGQPVIIENDVNLAMLGEIWQGSAKGCSNAAFLAIGTGVGLGLICNGKLVRGATGAAGEIAYLPIGSQLTSSEALDIGAFELEAGSNGILRCYNAISSTPASTVQDIFLRLDQGDAAASAALDVIAATLAKAIVSVAAIVDPEIVVLGGSIGIRAELAERVRQQLKLIFARPVPVSVSALGSRAGLVGALSSAVSRLHNQLFGIANLPGEITLPAGNLARAAE